MIDENKQKALISAYNAATKKLSEIGPYVEREYGKAYQNLVSAGMAQQIRKKYRYD